MKVKAVYKGSLNVCLARKKQTKIDLNKFFDVFLIFFVKKNKDKNLLYPLPPEKFLDTILMRVVFFLAEYMCILPYNIN